MHYLNTMALTESVVAEASRNWWSDCDATMASMSNFECQSKRRREEHINESGFEIANTLIIRPKRSIENQDTKVCLICQSRKYDKSKKNPLALTQCMTFEAGKKLTQAAEIRQDFRILGEISNKDPIAMEVCYHHRCYVNYIRKRSLDHLQGTSMPEGEDPYDAAYKSVVSDVLECSD